MHILQYLGQSASKEEAANMANQESSILSSCVSEESLSDCFQVVGIVDRILVVHTFTILLNGCIIVYENVVADTYRTLINKVVAIMAAYNIP